MVGLGWHVLLVQYPGFLHVPQAAWSTFHQHHSQAIGYLVVPAMLLELLTAAGLAWTQRQGQAAHFWRLLLLLTVICWLVTGLRGLPLHQSLSKNWDPAQIQSLIAWHAVRVCAWTLKGLLLAWLMHRLWVRRPD